MLKWINFCAGTLFGIVFLALLLGRPRTLGDFLGPFGFAVTGRFAFVTATVLVDKPENDPMRKAARLLNAVLIRMILYFWASLLDDSRV